MNSVSILGRLVASPELRTTPNGISVTTFTVAVNRAYVAKDKEREVDFIDCVAWRNTAEFLARYFRKGQMIAVTGKLQTRTYEDRDGNKRKAVEVMVDNVFFGGDRPSADTKAEAPRAVEQPEEPIYEDEDLPF